jgi:hypothetical protein
MLGVYAKEEWKRALSFVVALSREDQGMTVLRTRSAKGRRGGRLLRWKGCTRGKPLGPLSIEMSRFLKMLPFTGQKWPETDGKRQLIPYLGATDLFRMIGGFGRSLHPYPKSRFPRGCGVIGMENVAFHGTASS